MGKGVRRGHEVRRGEVWEQVGQVEVVASEAANEDGDVSMGMGEAVLVVQWSICCSARWDITITSPAPTSH